MKHTRLVIGGRYVIAAILLTILLLPALVGAQSAVTVITPAQGTTPKAAPTSTPADPNRTGLDVNIAGTTAGMVAPTYPLPVQASPSSSLPLPACNALLKAAAQPCR